MRLGLIIISLLLSSWSLFGQAAIEHQHMSGKKGFSEKQNINILSIPLLALKTEYSLVLGWSDSILLKTSQFAERLNMARP